MRGATLKIEFLHDDPNRALASRLRGWLNTATQLDLVVAFLTRRGADLLLQSLQASDRSITIAVSVRFPTNFDALASLHDRWPGRVHLHLGYKTPLESQGDRAQMHSKIVVIGDGSGTVRAIVGSHNWTATALGGLNGEASLMVEGCDGDEVIGDIRRHVAETLNGCAVFDPARIDYYREVQARLHRGPAQPGGDFDLEGYERARTLVLHAEAARRDLLDDAALLVYVPLLGQPEPALTVGTMVHLYLHAPQSLFGRRPTGQPAFFSGRVAMLNDVASGRVGARRIDSAADDPYRPVIDRTTVVPTARRAGFEVVANLVAQGRCEPLVYHSGGGKPGVRTDVAWERVDEPSGARSNQQPETERYLRGDPNWMRPAGELEEATLLVPRADVVYTSDPYLRVAERFGNRRGAEGLRRRASETSAADERRRLSWETDYLYLADGWLREAEL